MKTNEVRLIDANALLDAFANAKWFCNVDRDIAEDLILDAHTIDDAPAITGETSDGYPDPRRGYAADDASGKAGDNRQRERRF